MNISELKTSRDGFDFINIYSKGKTELGRDLSNFARFPFTHPKYGQFTSIEGLWYWLRTELLSYGWTEEQETERVHLRLVHGHDAKRLGKALLANVPETQWVDFPEETFCEGIIDGIRMKLRSHHRLLKAFANSTLPLVHYYTFGKEGNEVIRDGGHGWLIEALEGVRKELHYDFAEAFVYRLQESSDTPREKWTVWVDKSENRWVNTKLMAGMIGLCNRYAGKPATDKAWGTFRSTIKAMDAMDEKHIDSFILSHFIAKDTIKPVHDFTVLQHNGIAVKPFECRGD